MVQSKEPTPPSNGEPRPGADVPPPSPSLPDLGARARAGDRDALTELVRAAYSGRSPAAVDELLGFARDHLVKAALRHRRSASANPESMAQHGVLRLLHGLPELREPTAACLLAYLDRMAHNHVIDAERRRQRRHETTLGGDSAGHHKPAPKAPDATAAAFTQERFEFLLACCDDEDDRRLLRGRFVEQLGYAELGASFVPPRREDTVRMQITRLLVRLGNDARVRREFGS